MMLDPCFKVDYVSANDLAAVKERIIKEALNEDKMNVLLQPVTKRYC